MLDKKDAKILNLVQLDNKLTAEQIGERIGLSHTAVIRRLKRLRETEIIVADVARVAPDAVGYPVVVNIACILERDRPDTYDRFKEALRSSPNVVSADAVMGEADFTMIVVARTMDAFAAFRQNLMEEFPSLRKFTCLGVLEQIKRGPVPVDAVDQVETAER